MPGANPNSMIPVPGGVQISYMAGTILLEEQVAFQRIIFRTTRGKVLTYFSPEPFELKTIDGDKIRKYVYILVFQQGDYLRGKCQKVCQ